MQDRLVKKIRLECRQRYGMNKLLRAGQPCILQCRLTVVIWLPE